MSARPAELAPMGRGRGRYPDGHYVQVAEVWVEAIEDGARSPNSAVAETWNVPITTANMWIKKARARGLLPAWNAAVRIAAEARGMPCRSCYHCPPADHA